MPDYEAIIQRLSEEIAALNTKVTTLTAERDRWKARAKTLKGTLTEKRITDLQKEAEAAKKGQAAAEKAAREARERERKLLEQVMKG